ncbi:uncharacterized protein BP01DRAFT_357190 [Aspergillus saccharolyticus JOP 1030-1]|uniref:Uncharacterized protein n=1 Tax=Aspergillus saccharolyticus JOP 1030-1 TaxID=1450539 RepID=A0A318ZBN9_9EURO|nr:hypothetical protein BP01DRAFT_357190 [Aspergillus saccharolyticus JOP 1030-1]PYH44845.1 hypothetical protein BP01DRAFT_357190 [Aspergillus saccharolyticus JOP 1030-1]
MSRNFVPVVLAIGAGICSGYYVWQPIFKDLQNQKNGGVVKLEDASALSQQNKPAASTFKDSVPPAATDKSLEDGKAAGQ